MAPTNESEVSTRRPRFYPADDLPKPKAKIAHKPTKLRASITPGTILIVLAGRFKGKRVVFLKQLSSGLLLVTGPYQLNGVPFRRLNQRYVIATSTKLDISSVDLSKYDDSYLLKLEENERPANKSEDKFFSEEDKEEDSKQTVSVERKEDQKLLDGLLVPIVEAVPQMKDYLKARFSLKSGQKPHLMKF